MKESVLDRLRSLFHAPVPRRTPVGEQCAGAGLVFILGITPRSGTNYLHRLMSLHPECSGTQIGLWEDHLGFGSDHLVEYVEKTASRWRPGWGGKYCDRAELTEALGRGLESFLRRGCRTRYLVTKTPSPTGIENIPGLFPASRVLVVVRDGRDVTCSAMTSFGMTFEGALDQWIAGAERIIRFRERNPGFRASMVRYEDVVASLPEMIGRICDDLDLSITGFDMQAARRLPVYGSSDLVRSGASLHWRGEERSADFRPVGRWRSILTDEQKAEFWRRAGASMGELGYAQDG